MTLIKKIARLFSIYTILIANCLSFASPYAVDSSEIVAESAILINQDTGQVLFDKNANTPMYPASTTKILTALIILEDLPLEEIVTIDPKSPYAGGSHIALEPGEEVTVEQLLYALMIASANDAAEALAIHHSGSLAAFNEVMNSRAAELGAINSNFENPHGMPNKDHMTTAYDLAIISKQAMKNEMFRKIVRTLRYEIPPTNKKRETRYLNSTNSFYQGMSGSNTMITIKGKRVPIAYEFVTGVKRGYTVDAQNCLVTSATKDGQSYIVVVLKSNGDLMYTDTRLLLDYGLFGFVSHTINQSNDIIETITMNNKRKTQVPAIIENTISIDLPEGIDPNSIEKKVNILNVIDLPVKKGEILGTVSYYIGDTLLVSEPLVSSDDFAGEDLITEITHFFVTDEKPLFSKPWFTSILSRLMIAILLWRTIMTAIRIKRLKKHRIKTKVSQPKFGR